jgi:hypothetical protein
LRKPVLGNFPFLNESKTIAVFFTLWYGMRVKLLPGNNSKVSVVIVGSIVRRMRKYLFAGFEKE